WEKEINTTEDFNPELIELKNMLVSSKLISGAALKRKKSIGSHYITSE
ncbi:MAG: hypothetical protein UT63_C0051G0018, partial [Candidatus Gottesmanbacteria bacterium GW2011_GWC2_39_8]